MQALHIHAHSTLAKANSLKSMYVQVESAQVQGHRHQPAAAQDHHVTSVHTLLEPIAKMRGAFRSSSNLQ